METQKKDKMLRALLNYLFGTEYTGLVNLKDDNDSLDSGSNMEPYVPYYKPYKIGRLGINLIKNWESLRLESYQDGGGVWTIGYGYTKGVQPEMKITKEKAEELLTAYLFNQDIELNVLLKDVELVAQEQYDAIACFAYNIGCKDLKASMFLDRLKAKDWLGAAEQLVRLKQDGKYKGWVFDNGKVVRGLINRRLDEKKLFLVGSAKAFNKSDEEE